MIEIIRELQTEDIDYYVEFIEKLEDDVLNEWAAKFCESDKVRIAYLRDLKSMKGCFNSFKIEEGGLS